MSESDSAPHRAADGAGEGPTDAVTDGPSGSLTDDDGEPQTRREALGEPRHKPRAQLSGPMVLLRETVIVVVIALGLSLLIKTFLVQAFYIPSESMEDTLKQGDRVIVSKLTPGPFDLKHGDVVVFVDPNDWLLEQAPPEPSGPVRKALTFVGLLPNDSGNHLIKRVIGLPGDHVKCCDSKGRLSINGVPLDEPYLKPGSQPSQDPFDVTVPADKLWVMGDNRQHSEDSRYKGFVPMDKVTGRAMALVWPFDRATWLSRYAQTFAKVEDAGQ
ncbi:signal peptidase I [Angustibacter sp. McL0619]|uniref:signal peptidase I n=1 Tax=Angustibacter sp. McL0619 TaxID=3415676 RepID=UPI003CF9F5A6